VKTLAEPSGDIPGIVALPPLVLLAACATTGALQRLAPWHLGLCPAREVGGLLLACGVILNALSHRELHRAGTSVNPLQPTTAIVESGLYGFSRNPIYLGHGALLLGVGALLDSGWVVVALAAWLAVVRVCVIAREERYMAHKFGQAYLAYQARVRRWI
jgi:protein-S-isoprenylcysteine O-methyltransferase Ste14